MNISKDALIRWCESENPEPCSPEICGIMGIPCPRCQPNEYEHFIQNPPSDPDILKVMGMDAGF